MTTLLEKKAQACLGSGAVEVCHHDSSTARMLVTSSSGKEFHTVTFNTVEWVCDCPSRKECYHIVAAKLISKLRPKAKPVIPMDWGGIESIFQ